MTLERIPRLVGAGESHLQKNRLIAFIGLYPRLGGVTNKDITMKTFFIMPGYALIFLEPIRICLIAIVRAFQAMKTKITAPIIVNATAGLRFVGRIFNDDPFVKSARYIARAKVHFADIDTTVAMIGQILHPGPLIAPILKSIGPCSMRGYMPVNIAAREAIQVAPGQ